MITGDLPIFLASAQGKISVIIMYQYRVESKEDITVYQNKPS